MKDTNIFDDLNLSDLFRDIHEATLRKRTKIDDLIIELRNLIKKPEDAVIVAPIIKDYLDVMVRNDEHLIKIATIVQRLIAVETNNSGASGIEDLLSEKEKEALVKDALKELDEATAELEAKKVVSDAKSLIEGKKEP